MMLKNFTFNQLNLNNPRQFTMWKDFLRKNNLNMEEGADYAVGVFNDEQLIATASFRNNVIKYIAISKEYRNSGLLGELLSHITAVLAQKGIYHHFIYTKPSLSRSFQYFGFKEIALTDKVALLERSTKGIEFFRKELAKFKTTEKTVGCIVMNANPFTKGHLYLVEKASQICDVIHIFLVEEDISYFSFESRYTLVMKGISHLRNVYLHTGGSYMISQATFPSYFLESNKQVAETQAELDAVLFKNKIAPVLNITKRFIGDEPFSATTNLYNQQLKRILEPEIEVIQIRRCATDDGVTISASKVRDLFKQGNLEEINKYVPIHTYDYLSEIVNNVNVMGLNEGDIK